MKLFNIVFHEGLVLIKNVCVWSILRFYGCSYLNVKIEFEEKMLKWAPFCESVIIQF